MFPDTSSCTFVCIGSSSMELSDVLCLFRLGLHEVMHPPRCLCLCQLFDGSSERTTFDFKIVFCWAQRRPYSHVAMSAEEGGECFRLNAVGSDLEAQGSSTPLTFLYCFLWKASRAVCAHFAITTDCI